MAQHPTPTPSTCVDAHVLRSWLALAVTTAQRSRRLIDSLNVFPVPDADTGTNVLLTLRAAHDALTVLPTHADAVQLSRAVADGAVRGARGNSGLLLSQALSALADDVAAAPHPTGLRPVELVHAYEHMASSTWAAVSRPVSGTLLTVARDAATAARTALNDADATHPATVSDIAAAAALGAQESVVETAGLGHGPVDAGGAAFMLLLTALSDCVNTPTTAHLPHSESAPALTDVASQMLSDLAASGVTHGADADADASTGEFEVMYLLEATAAVAQDLRAHLETIGDSVGVVGTPDALGVGMYQVHVHTDTPRSALPRHGRARQICIHHLHPTTLALAGRWDAAEPPLPLSSSAQGTDNVVSLERLAASRRRRAGATASHMPHTRNGRTSGRAAGASRQTKTGQSAALGMSARDDALARRRAATATNATSMDGPRRPGETASRTDRTPDTHRQGPGIIACTRAPGLIEQLARTGAVVVLHPERDGIMRAVGDLARTDILVLPCDADSAAAAHDAARHLAARAVPSLVCAPVGSHSGVTPTGGSPRTAGQHTDVQTPAPPPTPSPQVLVADTDDDARVLAAAVALAATPCAAPPTTLPSHSLSYEPPSLTALARQAALASATMRTLALHGHDAEADAVATAAVDLLRPDDELLTLILGRDALPDVGSLVATAVAQRSQDLTGDSEAVEVVVHAGGQTHPDVLLAVE